MKKGVVFVAVFISLALIASMPLTSANFLSDWWSDIKVFFGGEEPQLGPKKFDFADSDRGGGGKPPAETCGNGVCASTETCLTCESDCGPCPAVDPFCGDNICNSNETCSSCELDCGVCPTINDSCTDTDGGIVSEIKGTVEVVKNGVSSFHEDSCNYYNISETLGENYCSGNAWRVIPITCQNGCSNGACLPPGNNTCTDTDGDDIFVQGEVVIMDEEGNVISRSTDFCTGPEAYTGVTCSVVEYTCSDGELSQSYVFCPNCGSDSSGAVGCIIEAGACTKTADQCSDGDAYRLNPEFYPDSARGWLDGFSYLIKDVCLDSSTLIEQTCSGVKASNETIFCNEGCVDEGFGGFCFNSTLASKTCTDSDGGINLNEAGNTTVCILGNCVTKSDYCFQEGTKVMEYRCSNNNDHMFFGYSCPNGCSNGACLPDSNDTSGGLAPIGDGSTTECVEGSIDFCQYDCITTEDTIEEDSPPGFIRKMLLNLGLIQADIMFNPPETTCLDGAKECVGGLWQECGAFVASSQSIASVNPEYSKTHYYAGTLLATKTLDINGELIEYYVQDHLGSTRKVTDLTSDTQADTNYYAFGESR